MIKLRLNTSMQALYDYVDNRLSLRLIENQLRVDKARSVKIFNVERVVDDVIWYLNREPKRGSIIVDASKMRKQGKVEPCLLAIILRSSSDDQVDVYLDPSEEAIQKGLLSKEMKKGWARYFRKIVAAVILLPILFFPPAWPLLPFLVILAALLSPFGHLVAKRRFKQRQAKLSQLAALFESDFSVIDKVVTNDFVTFWGKVKSNVSLDDFIP